MTPDGVDFEGSGETQKSVIYVTKKVKISVFSGLGPEPGKWPILGHFGAENPELAKNGIFLGQNGHFRPAAQIGFFFGLEKKILGGLTGPSFTFSKKRAPDFPWAFRISFPPTVVYRGTPISGWVRPGIWVRGLNLDLQK